MHCGQLGDHWKGETWLPMYGLEKEAKRNQPKRATNPKSTKMQETIYIQNKKEEWKPKNTT